MRVLRAATLTVSDLARSRDLYCHWLDYSVAELGHVSSTLGAAWGAPKCAGADYCVLRPASGRDVFVRMIAQPAHPDYVPLTSYGWAAIEICNQDTDKVAARMKDSPFEIIGPPKVLDGMPAIYPMQVKGPDGEIVYLTEIRADIEAYDLPRAQSLIDCLFILVMACRDIDASLDWLARHCGLTSGRTMEIIYSMINNAFELPADTKHKLSTMKHGRDVCLEVDALPVEATPRPRHEGFLPPCVAMGSLLTDEFDALHAINTDLWITPPAAYDSVIYGGKRSATLRAPDGTLVEIIES